MDVVNNVRGYLASWSKDGESEWCAFLLPLRAQDLNSGAAGILSSRRIATRPTRAVLTL